MGASGCGAFRVPVRRGDVIVFSSWAGVVAFFRAIGGPPQGGWQWSCGQVQPVDRLTLDLYSAPWGKHRNTPGQACAQWRGLRLWRSRLSVEVEMAITQLRR